jgi:hypothetical protein
MNKVEDVLVKWADLIAFAREHVGAKSMEDPACCIADLAAELRALRAELEADAALGRLAKENAEVIADMALEYNGYYEYDYCTICGAGAPAGVNVEHHSDCRWGALIAALEAARKGETCSQPKN